MPMIDVYAAEGTFTDKHTLAQNLAQAVMRWEQVPEIPLFSDNTAAFIHDLPAEAIANAAGRGRDRGAAARHGGAERPAAARARARLSPVRARRLQARPSHPASAVARRARAERKRIT